ncbi:MAG TPA: tetratricopeptide repeat protein, partial [Terracidiphilus sp.]
MKLARSYRAVWLSAAALLAASAAGATLRPGAYLLAAELGESISGWLQNAVAGSPVEAALYRTMQLPGGAYLFRRSPREALPALTQLIAKDPADASLWQLKALEDERALDFDAAEHDWKTWVEKAPDKSAAELELANFYERRLRPQEELSVLETVGRSPASPQERLTPSPNQRAWKAWESALRVAQQYDLPKSVTERDYRAWEDRYPHENSVYSQEFNWLLKNGEYSAATNLIARYRSSFPRDDIAPVQYEAELAAKEGSPQDGLAVYDRSFQPLWPSELVSAWYQLLLQGRQVRSVSDQLRAKIAAQPADLADTARLFYIEQQEGQPASARQVLADFRKRQDASGAMWSDVELYTLARLYETVQEVPEAARYYYALASNRTQSGTASLPDAHLRGLAGLSRLLLSNPDQPLRVGSANLSLYRDIGTMDRGPGYLNGILSLLLNSSSPDSELAQEEQLAAPYFHRAKAAEILAEIDEQYPTAPERADLHAQLIQAYLAYGQNEAVIREGTAFLAAFPEAAQRVQVALETADAYDRIGLTDKEFAIYQSLLTELAASAGGLPLGEAGSVSSEPVSIARSPQPRNFAVFQGQNAEAKARSPQYAEVLNRYLSRLVALKRLPDALAVLRGEVERNPQDPGLYERLAQFFEQNLLDAQVGEVYQRAIQQFQTEGWYARLARFYLRERREADYQELSRKVTDIFSGTELEQYLAQAPAPDWRLAFAVHLYANQRFPHDLVFVQNLIGDYQRMHQQREVDNLLWAHWSESPNLRNQLFERLSSSGQLDSVLASLRQQSPQIGTRQWSSLAESNPAAERFWVAACIWQSHFEEAVAGADALSAAYPGDSEVNGEAASLYRSFAYFHPEDTDKAVTVENRMLSASPGDLNAMARIGDIYADRGRMSDAASYWVRISNVHPGDSNGYLQAATIFWDYFDFAQALNEIETARKRLNDPTLFGYQAGAIEESQGDVNAAIHEYVASALNADPSDESRSRLLTLAHRPALQNVIEGATSALLQGNAPAPAAIALRVSILEAEGRRDRMTSELKALATRTESFDVLDAITTTAQNQSLPDVAVASLQRQIALTTDPVRNLQLRYQLADLLVTQKQTAQASAEIDAIYRESPKILGVVRTTVNFDWDHDRKPQAVVVLLDAAQAAYPELQRDFRLEAANKLTSLGDFARARGLLDALLAARPLDPRFESAMAENYARSGDQAGLAAFDRSELAQVRTSSLAPAEKQERMAQLRRSMISAASVLGNWSDAVDQYVELINSYPDDAPLAQEAALYAAAHNQRDRLLAYYEKTIQTSPQDPRWSIVLARLATAAEDFPAAITAYGKAIALRPERQDLLTAQADLNARLQRFDDAAADYQKLYVLSYHDPQWMQQVAEARARQGRAAEAVQALQTAWIEGRPVKAANFFSVAAQLEKWNLLDAAQQFAEQGVDAAGSDLLVNDANQNGAVTYARIMARLRQTDTAWVRLNAARRNAGDVPIGAGMQQVASHGFAGDSSDEWRRQQQHVRAITATAGFAQALRTIGSVAATYYTPEEKVQFAAWLRGKSSDVSSGDLREIYLP